jgi:hypothetical protein
MISRKRLPALVGLLVNFSGRDNYSVNGFADNLVTTTVGCMTELSTDEVIMNNVVKAVEDSDYPKMHLAVLVDGNHVESPYHYDPSSSKQLTLSFINPYSREDYPEGGDLQFVMDVVQGPAEFIGGGALGCDNNKRVSGRLMGGGNVQLQINDAAATIQIVAGWSAGHEAVRLTPVLELQPKASAAASNEKEHPHDKVKGEEEARRKEKADSIPEVDEAKVQESMNKLADAIKTKKRNKNQEDLIKIEESDISVDEGSSKQKQKEHPNKRAVADDEIGEGLGAASKEKIGQKVKAMMSTFQKKAMLQEKEQRKRLEEEMEKNFPDEGKSFRERYHADDFGASLHMSGFYFGCAFFIFAMGSLLKIISSKKDKGRRDL